MTTVHARQIRQIYEACALPIDKTLHDLPMEQLQWRPAPDSRSIGEIVRHVIRVSNWFLKRQGFEPIAADPGEKANADELRRQLNRLHRQIDEILENCESDEGLRDRYQGTDAGEHETLAEVIIHIAMHYLYHQAQLIYLRRAQDRQWEAPLQDWENATYIISDLLSPLQNIFQ